MKAKGRLVRCFPGPAITVYQDRINDPSFRHSLVQCLSKLDTQAIPEACPVTKKAGNKVEETRDSRHVRNIACRQAASFQEFIHSFSKLYLQ
jgi:hypothetical protein